MSRVTFQLSNYTLEQIKEDYHLYDLCVENSTQLENIAITIQSLYFYHNLLVAEEYSKSIESSLCRTTIIMGYSILEAIVISVGYKLQKMCQYCGNRCRNCSISIFEENNEYENEKKAFKNASEFLMNIGVIHLTPRASYYYNKFRDMRNNIHLARNSGVISEESFYTKSECKNAVNFLQDFIDMLYENYNEFCYCYGCGG